MSFFWKVSSEIDFDFLKFYIDGSLQDRISGSVDWYKMTYEITDTDLHTLEWRYIKDVGTDSGSDCGWVDKVEWVPRGGSGMWQAPILPVVDFNGDENVDSADMCIMVDHFGESYSLCDIGPTPLGDGIVDIQDMIVLAEHLFEEIPPAEPLE